jgi:Domain of unknown function (DUF4304)
MMLLGNAYNELIKSQSKLLINQGFKKKGFIFASKQECFWHVVGWQKSKESNNRIVKFTLNIGLHNLKLAEIEGNDPDMFPDIWACHYLERVGVLMPVGKDCWWEISSEKLDATLDDEFAKLFNTVVFPFFERFNEANSLLDLWQTGVSPGQTDYARQRYISLLKQ